MPCPYGIDPPREFLQRQRLPAGACQRRHLAGEDGARHARNAQLERPAHAVVARSEEHTSELQSRLHLVCRLLLEKKKKNKQTISSLIDNNLIVHALITASHTLYSW